MRFLRTLDLCAGAGGWSVAARGLPIDFVCVADRAPDCIETWATNNAMRHPDCVLCQVDLATEEGMRAVRDVCTGGIDLVLGGIPCEQVSTARANRPHQPGEMEALQQLIDNCWELVAALRPCFWCFEDVAQIKPYLPSPLFGGLNYTVRTIHAEEYGPQARTRIFFGSFPEPAPAEPGPRTLGEILRPGPYRTLPQLAKYQRSRSKWYGGNRCRVQGPEKPGATVIGSQGGCGSRNERSGMVPLARVQDTSQPCPTVADFGSRHERAALIEQERELRGREKPAPSGQVARTVVSGKSGEQLVQQECDPFGRERSQGTESAAATVVAATDANRPVEQEGLVRIMEWQEAALLQGFPSDFVFAASWSRTWKLVSQAIPIFVGRAILQAIVQQWQQQEDVSHD